MGIPADVDVRAALAVVAAQPDSAESWERFVALVGPALYPRIAPMLAAWKGDPQPAEVDEIWQEFLVRLWSHGAARVRRTLSDPRDTMDRLFRVLTNVASARRKKTLRLRAHEVGADGGGGQEALGLSRFPDRKTRPAADEAAGRETCEIVENAADENDPIESQVWPRLTAGESRREAAQELRLDRSKVQRAAKKVSERLRRQFGLDENGREIRE